MLFTIWKMANSTVRLRINPNIKKKNESSLKLFDTQYRLLVPVITDKKSWSFLGRALRWEGEEEQKIYVLLLFLFFKYLRKQEVYGK